MKLSNLLVMQSSLRHTNDMSQMISYVANGGFWTQEFLNEYSLRNSLPRVSPLISVTRFEDGLCFIHDGNHRTCSVYLGGRDYLREDEYFITDWKYSDYMEINPKKNWYTPFDPKVHARTADFFAFKAEAKLIFEKEPHNALSWLENNYHKYRVKKQIHSVIELANEIKGKIK
jgi:hypothetical protein